MCYLINVKKTMIFRVINGTISLYWVILYFFSAAF
uniref:Uncharacterized protein n=1 Tax=Setaria italica TaxID=4555 RepID=K3ZGG2_SETIT